MENPALPSNASEHDYRCVSGLLSRAGDKCRPRTRSGAGALGLHDCEPSALPAATYFLKPCCRISRDRVSARGYAFGYFGVFITFGTTSLL